MNRPRLSVVLPVYNENETIAEVIEAVLGQKLEGVDLELIVVESNSTDGTRAVVQSYRTDARVRVVLQDAPAGKGNAVREGLRCARGDIILIQDGDLEYKVEDYPSLLAPIIRGHADFVLGCRHVPGRPMREFDGNRATSKVLNAAHWFFTGLFNVAFRSHLADPFTMYKVFRAECIEGLPLVANRFDFDWEIVAKLVRRGYVPVEVPVSYTSRGFDKGKKVRLVRDPLTWFVAVVRFRLCEVPPRPVAVLPRSERMGKSVRLETKAEGA
jgi:glycosyltransferase involved in cell wall biosynthesis